MEVLIKEVLGLLLNTFKALQKYFNFFSTSTGLGYVFTVPDSIWRSSPSYVYMISYGLNLCVLSLAFDFASIDKIHGLLCSCLLWFPVVSLCSWGEALVVFSDHSDHNHSDCGYITEDSSVVFLSSGSIACWLMSPFYQHPIDIIFVIQQKDVASKN